MIHALDKHKISHDIRNELWNMEDAKTSSIIGNLLHLPTELFWKILYNSTSNDDGHHNSLPKEIGKILSVEFWPYWNLDHKVEPDVFIRFEKFDLIVELKRNDYNEQKVSQWTRQLKAYKKKYGEEKDVYLIAISGATDKTESRVFQCSWQSLLEETKRLQQQPNDDYIDRILDSTLKAFAFHGESPYHYLEKIPAKDFAISKKSLENFKTIW